ncbi:dTDP-4-dehydrorhamnose 3,5-epimerase [Aquisalinus flavus]|uniref:dTDP-4-dehydrorhamnose 3,5-epimerase n=1 Tax=Aquisalinus flavus TaxID=1526572 RepID=A0A8J2V5A6_9PROT|nr:dTDP-4-dehydrorhamnose 3,5-epimerase [Aquisalinus flavus]MBD0426222.1 dTDP-4-dehydrorhamnose 3,5-epimerase [Aquisalinus flavus]UNE48206.1 dTDP-4-dehydrorhamnose 3,5-epimerase [Aquisalinus flavus]GGD09626.1 dTDP-4-dehydrorhamnose 3,5-epimerase [Aquisalinus flavus]
MLEVTELDIPEVKLLKPRVFADNRGYFTETYNKTRFDEKAVPLGFVQDNESYSKHKYTVRGLHYQAPPYAQDKLVRVVHGSVLDVAVDVRRGSPTYGKWVSAELSAENGTQILVPAGFLHGFITLEPDTLVVYKVTALYSAEADGNVHWFSPELGIDWGVTEDQAVLSDKDAKAPPYSEFETPFDYS